MKIDTKLCEYIVGAPQEAVIRPNKYIPSNTPKVEKTTVPPAATASTTCKTLDMGRRIMYLPSIVYTPVVTSARQRECVSGKEEHVQSKKQRRLLAADDMDALNLQLEALFIKSGEENYDSDNDTETTVESSSTASMGRVQSTTFSYKTNTLSNVWRSSRFQK
jgi:hypothetical protein